VDVATIANKNRILAKLSPDDRSLLLPHLRYLELKVPDGIIEAKQPIEYAYFPTDGLLSMVRQMESGAVIEVAAQGAEGAVGTQVLLGQMTLPYRCFVQVEGAGFRIGVDALLRFASGRPSFMQLILRYHAAVNVQVMQNAACNGLHGIEARCCRWLLMTADRLGSNQIALTHEFLGQMLGVRRASVSEVLKPMREQGLLDYTRGSVTLLDREGLQAGSCECYRVITDELDEMV
jgi:CRP-like cAMP-binding protein